MDDTTNYDDQAQVQNATVTFPVFVSVVGIISVALAVMLYHLILLRYCRHHHYYPHPHHHASDPALADDTNGPRRILVETDTSALGPVTTWFGLDDRALEAIPVLPYCERALDFFRIEQSECVVCLGILERGERVRWLPGCAHAFHVACIDGWLRARASCPTCRAPVVVPPPLLRQFVGGAAFVNGGMTRARSGGALRWGGVGKDQEEVVDPNSLCTLGLKRSLSVDDHSCIVNVDAEGGGGGGEGVRNERDISSSSIVSSSSWRPTGLMRSIFGIRERDGGHGILPY